LPGRKRGNMPRNELNILLMKFSKKQLGEVLDDLPRIPFDMEEDKRTRRVPMPDSKNRLIIYIRYHWFDSEINETLKSLKLPFLKKQTVIDDLTKNEIKRRWRIIFEREMFRPSFYEIESRLKAQSKLNLPVRYTPRELYLCGSKQWQQNLERVDREEQKKCVI
jgi:hypothetical protein